MAILRAIPFLVTAVAHPPPGTVATRALFAPADWLAYCALIRQGWGPFANPFTTEPQGRRIVLLLHQVLGAVHQATGADPFWLLELARVPMLLLFTWALWRFVERVHVEHAARVWACVLVLLSGGVAFVIGLAAPVLPAGARATLGRDLWTANGWSTFESSYNPVWLAGLTLALVALRLSLQPGGPASRRDAATLAGVFSVTWLVHPYSAVAVAAATGGSLMSEWISEERGARARAVRVATALAPAAMFVAAVVVWQRGDRVFRAASGGFLGGLSLPIAWYPLTFGAVGFFAIRGLRRWAMQRHPWRHGLAGWLGAVALLHSSNLINGYHYVFALHTAVAIVAAPAVAEWFARSNAPRMPAILKNAVMFILLFSSPLVVTGLDTRAQHVSADVAALVKSVGALPPGNVLATPEIGNLVPAYGPHRVFAGHWFMTPDYASRARLAKALLSDPARTTELEALVRRERIDYVIAPASLRSALDVAGLRAADSRQFGDLVVLTTSHR